VERALCNPDIPVSKAREIEDNGYGRGLDCRTMLVFTFLLGLRADTSEKTHNTYVLNRLLDQYAVDINVFT
jgi:hypothetical protein